MSEIHRNFIGGDWVAGAETARNINPSDLSDVIGEYARAERAFHAVRLLQARTIAHDAPDQQPFARQAGVEAELCKHAPADRERPLRRGAHGTARGRYR